MKTDWQKNKKSGFTLIELLAIISIIGFIASAGTILFLTARDKARIAKGMQFSQSVNNALGSEAVGIWAFDEGSGMTALDGSGNGRNGALINDPTWRCASADADHTPSGTGCSLQFDGIDDYVEAASASIGTDVSISLWYKRTGATNTYVPLVEQGGARRFRLLLYGGRPRFGWNSATDDLYGTSKQYHTLGKWYHLVATYDGSPHLYIDGQEITPLAQSAGSYSSWNTDKLRIAYRPYTSSVGPFNGLIDDVRVYGQALAFAQIKQIFAEGEAEHKLAQTE